ncbi:hypothetical protein ACS0TY_026289 [Phlomoides rotata]
MRISPIRQAFNASEKITSEDLYATTPKRNVFRLFGGIYTAHIHRSRSEEGLKETLKDRVSRDLFLFALLRSGDEIDEQLS